MKKIGNSLVCLPRYLDQSAHRAEGDVGVIAFDQVGDLVHVPLAVSADDINVDAFFKRTRR